MIHREEIFIVVRDERLKIIKDLEQIGELRDNYIKIGEKVDFKESEVKFQGKNNILFIEDNVKIRNTKLLFLGDNGIIYISSSNMPISMDCFCSNNSVVFLGRNIYINSYSSYKLVLGSTEQENIIIGKDCLLSYGICMRTADPHVIYDCNTKKRINFSKSILIGDHVWIGQNVLILKGSEIGSGAIIGGNSVVANKIISSNSSVGGNPCRVLRNDVFFTRDCVHNYLTEETYESMLCDSDKYIYQKNNTNLDFKVVNEMLKKKSLEDKLEIIKEVLVDNANKDKFYIE